MPVSIDELNTQMKAKALNLFYILVSSFYPQKYPFSPFGNQCLYPWIRQLSRIYDVTLCTYKGIAQAGSWEPFKNDVMQVG